MLDIIAKPFGLLLLWFYNLTGNYGIAIFLFALIVKLIMLPFQIRSQRSMVRMSALNPQLQELQRRHEANPQKYQEEVSKLYKEEHVNPMSGCLWMLVPYPIMLALWRAIRFPLTTMMGVPAELLQEGGSILEKLNELGFTASARSAYVQLEQSRFISDHFADFAGLSDKLVNINYTFLGLDLGSSPSLNFSETGVNWGSIGLILIPIVSAALSWLQMKLSQATNPTGNAAGNEQAQRQMQTMNLIMPLFSLWICFSMPAAVGLYWVFGSVLAIIQSLILNKYFAGVVAKETEEREARAKEREAEWARKHEETERLRAEGATKENENTSKKKQKSRQKNELDELRAAAIREERAAKRAAMGIVDEEEEIPPSQVGNRRYARGRAYDPDRFTRPEHTADVVTPGKETNAEGAVVETDNAEDVVSADEVRVNLSKTDVGT